MMRYRIVVTTLVAGLICVSGHAQTTAQTYPYQRCFEVSATMHKVPVELLLAVAATESNWDPDARSHANAHGVMQIQWPGTARHLGVRRVAELYNPCFNIGLGAQYLAQLLQDFDGNETRALAAYNYGPTRIAASKDLPAGAQKYAATVNGHKQNILKGLIPRKLQPGKQHKLVAFNSKTRAENLADYLRSHLQGATIAVHPPTDLVRTHTVVLAIGQAGLTAQDHITIRNLGWTI